MKNIPVVTDVKQLHEKSVDITDETMDIVKAASGALLAAYTKLGGKAQGLAAPQVGFKYNVILLRKNGCPEFIYNVHILWSFGKCKSNEGCISEGDVRYIVERPLLAKVEYWTYPECRHVVKTLRFPKTRVICHEIDHINGRLLQDWGIRA